jgi:hypothetical protein
MVDHLVVCGPLYTFWQYQAVQSVSGGWLQLTQCRAKFRRVQVALVAHNFHHIIVIDFISFCHCCDETQKMYF